MSKQKYKDAKVFTNQSHNFTPSLDKAIKSYLIYLSNFFSKILLSSIKAVLWLVRSLSIDDCSFRWCWLWKHENLQLLQVMDFVSRYLPAYHAYLPTLYKEGPNGAKKDHLLVIDIDEERTPISGSWVLNVHSEMDILTWWLSLGFLIFLRPFMPSKHHRPLVSYGLNIYPKRVNSMYIKFCYLYKETGILFSFLYVTQLYVLILFWNSRFCESSDCVLGTIIRCISSYTHSVMRHTFCIAIVLLFCLILLRFFLVPSWKCIRSS